MIIVGFCCIDVDKMRVPVRAAGVDCECGAAFQDEAGRENGCDSHFQISSDQ